MERQDAIQEKLAKKHLADGTFILYDITSSYMEGEYRDSKLVDFGYNRDQKRGHEQIVISLLCSKDGCPVAVEVFNGSTKDETTVLKKIDEIKEKYGIGKVVFVGDRGMVTQAKYAQIDNETVKVISALTHGAIKKLCERGIIQMNLLDERNIVEVIDGKIRYCLCKNPDKPLFDSDGAGADRKYTFDYIIETLKSIRKEDVDVCGEKSSVITTPSDEQKHILKLLGVTL